MKCRTNHLAKLYGFVLEPRKSSRKKSEAGGWPATFNCEETANVRRGKNTGGENSIFQKGQTRHETGRTAHHKQRVGELFEPREFGGRVAVVLQRRRVVALVGVRVGNHLPAGQAVQVVIEHTVAQRQQQGRQRHESEELPYVKPIFQGWFSQIRGLRVVHNSPSSLRAALV